MKYVLNLLAIAITITLFTSCSSTQKFSVSGTPGTVITDSRGMYLTTIDNTGTAELKLKRKEGYSPFLQAKTPNSDLLVPFALDYKDKNICEILDWTSGVACILSYCITLSNPSSIPLWIFLITADGFWLSEMVWSGFFHANDEINKDYNYLKLQQTNNDLIK